MRLPIVLIRRVAETTTHTHSAEQPDNKSRFLKVRLSFDTYLYLLNSSGQIIAEDDDGGGGTNSRIPATSGFFTLPASGTYTIRTSAYFTGVTGSYSVTLNLNGGGCPTVPISPGQTINGSLATTDCIFTGTTRYVDIYTFSGSAGQRIAVSMSSTVFDTYLYLLNPSNEIIVENITRVAEPTRAFRQRAAFLLCPPQATTQFMLLLTAQA